MTQNVYDALLTYHPRDGHTPKENFLTEAFAHTLRSHPEICVAWISHVTGEPIDALNGSPEVETQAHFIAPDGNSRSIVDLVIRWDHSDGVKRQILSEHKWDSPADPAALGRLDNYCVIAKAEPGALVFFIARDAEQVAIVAAHNKDVNAVHWRDVYEFLRKYEGHWVVEFVEFLKLHGLGPSDPLSSWKLAAYGASRSVETDCLKIAAQLAGRDWGFLPKRFSGSVSCIKKMRWGRIGVELGNWGSPPILFLGFMLDGTDHKLELVSPATIDLMLSLDNSAPEQIVNDTTLVAPADALRRIGAVVHYGAQIKSKWRQIVAREPLAQTIRGRSTEAEQGDAIYHRLKQWAELLFSDGQIEKTLLKAHKNP